MTKKAKKVRKTKKRPRRRAVKVSPWLVAGLSAGVVLIMVMLFSIHRGDSSRGARIPEGNWRYGIDISHNNEGEIVWDSLYVMIDHRRRTVRDPFKAMDIRPVSFVYIKATEGATFKDRDFKKNWSEAGRSNIRRGAYHFFRSSKDPAQQARNFIESVGTLYLGDLPPVLDVETIHRGCTKKLLNEKILKWLKIVEQEYHMKPIVYANASFIKDNLSDEITDSYPIWVAHYGRSKPAWKDWHIWQVTDRAIVKGVPKPVDLDVMEME